MSENEIKPVAWTSETQLMSLKIGGDGIMADAGQKKWCIPLYDQSAIDRLTAERDAALASRDRYWDERDEAQRKLSVAVANGNALVADAERLEWVVSNAHMRVQGRGDSWSVMDCGNGLTFVCRNALTMREAIDAARAEGWV